MINDWFDNESRFVDERTPAYIVFVGAEKIGGLRAQSHTRITLRVLTRRIIASSLLTASFDPLRIDVSLKTA